jgi:sulfur-oxidizing protein SoxX
MKISTTILLAVCATGLLACSANPAGPDLDKLTADVVKTSFRSEGIATIDRLQQDEANRVCSAADTAGKPLDPAIAKALEASNLKTVKAPADGKYLGNWKEGEKIAQNGRGLTWTDNATDPNGGNCYNCHQITKEEVSFGTIGPTLYNYGKLRGVTNPDAAESRAMVEYTWGKIWNARGYNACSNMPRFGHNAILSEKQIKDVMALLLDPKSVVNAP